MTTIQPGADRMTCPRCAHVVPMSFIWPSPQSDADVERVIGRFQRCTVCGWQGDAMIWKPYDIKRRDAKTLLIDGQAVTDLHAWLVQIGLIGAPVESKPTRSLHERLTIYIDAMMDDVKLALREEEAAASYAALDSQVLDEEDQDPDPEEEWQQGQYFRDNIEKLNKLI